MGPHGQNGRLRNWKKRAKKVFTSGEFTISDSIESVGVLTTEMDNQNVGLNSYLL